MTSSEKTEAKCSPSDRGDATAKDLVVPLPEYLREVSAILQRAEEAYTQGNLAQCLQSADEGLTVLSPSMAKLCQGPIPGHYAVLFHCFRHLEVFRTALALYKQGLLFYRRPESGANLRAHQHWEEAWRLVETQFSGYDERMTLGGAHYDFPVAGRILRSVIRLREKLQECSNGTLPPPS